MTRINRVESRKELEQSLDEYMTRGFKIKSQGQHSARIKEKDYGDIPAHGFLFLFAFLVGAVTFDALGLPSLAVWGVALGSNICYAAYSWKTATEILIKVEDADIR